MPVIEDQITAPPVGIMPDHACDRGTARLDPGASRSQAYQPDEGVSETERQHSVTNADLRRGARSPNPGAARLADHMGRRGKRRQASQSIRPDDVTLEGAGSLRSLRSRRLIDGQVNRDASPHTESPRSSLRRGRPQLGASCWRGVLRVGARAGPARTAARAVPAVLAEQDRPGPPGVRWL